MTSTEARRIVDTMPDEERRRLEVDLEEWHREDEAKFVEDDPTMIRVQQ